MRKINRVAGVAGFANKKFLECEISKYLGFWPELGPSRLGRSTNQTISFYFLADVEKCLGSSR